MRGRHAGGGAVHGRLGVAHVHTYGGVHDRPGDAHALGGRGVHGRSRVLHVELQVGALPQVVVHVGMRLVEFRHSRVQSDLTKGLIIDLDALPRERTLKGVKTLEVNAKLSLNTTQTSYNICHVSSFSFRNKFLHFIYNV